MTNLEGNNRKWTQDEIINNTKNVVRGLETLKNEHSGILNTLNSNCESDGENELEREKGSIIQESIDKIELGLGEAQVGITLRTVYTKGVCFFQVSMKHPCNSHKLRWQSLLLERRIARAHVF